MKERPRYTVLYYRCDGGWSAYFPTYPEIIVWYPTLTKAKQSAREALELFLRTLEEHGEKPRRETGTPKLGSVAV